MRKTFLFTDILRCNIPEKYLRHHPSFQGKRVQEAGIPGESGEKCMNEVTSRLVVADLGVW